MNQSTFKLVAWVRVDGTGNPIPGSLEFRKRGIIPQDGRWIQVPNSYCCAEDLNSYIVFSSTNGATNITNIKVGSFNWTGVLDSGDTLVVPLFASYDYTVTITTDAFAGSTLTTATVQGSGVITSPGALTSNTTTFTVTSGKSQYTAILS